MKESTRMTVLTVCCHVFAFFAWALHDAKVLSLVFVMAGLFSRGCTAICKAIEDNTEARRTE